MAAQSPEPLVDPVCGMRAQPGTPGYRTMQYQSRRYHFCSPACLEWFKEDPRKYLRTGGRLPITDRHIMRTAAQADEAAAGEPQAPTDTSRSSTDDPGSAAPHPPVPPIFQRSPANPILTPRDMPVPAAAVLNPGATEHDGDTVLLLRAENATGYSSVYVARSEDGTSNWRIDAQPLLGHGDPGRPYETWGCEDARVTCVPEEECWYITYVAYSPMGPAVGLARTRDFVQVERLGLLGTTNDKDAVLLPRRFDGRWMILHRPDAAGREHIWASRSPDLAHWGEAHCVMLEGTGPAWDQVRIGAGPPPIETEAGWLLIYHGVKAYAGRTIYRAGVALLDRHQPSRLIARAPGWIFQAEAPYELSGLVPNVVFPTGLLLRDGELHMYYGAADTCVCLATARLDDVLGTLVETPPPNHASME